MLTLSEMITHVCSKTGKTDEESRRLARDFLRFREQQIYDAHFWKASKVLYSVTSSAEILFMPHDIEMVSALRVDKSKRLRPRQLETFFEEDPAIFERVGKPSYFTTLYPLATRLPTDGGVVTVVSNNTNDTTTTILLRGRKGGNEVRQELVLNGTTPVSSAPQQYDEIEIFTKEETVGTVTLADGSNTLQVLWPEETSRRHIRVRLHAKPDVSENYLFLCKRRRRALTKDGDVCAIPGTEYALMALAIGDLLERMRQYAKAQVKFQEGSAMVALAVQKETAHEATAMYVMPSPLDYAVPCDEAGFLKG